MSTAAATPNAGTDDGFAAATGSAPRSGKRGVATKNAAEVTVVEAAATPTEEFAALAHEYAVEKNADGTVTVKDVPVFGENERSSFAGDVKYDAEWLRGAHKADEQLRGEKYQAPMHFGHHTFAGGNVERAGHYEVTGVRKVKHLGQPKHVAFANLVFKNEAAFEKYRSDYPYRSVEISHERPNQINSLALLSSEAPFFQFPCGNHKFGVELAPGEQAKAHYFSWKCEADETFAGFPPKKSDGKAPKAGKAPRFGDGAEEAQGQSDGADGMAGQDAGDGQPMDAGSHNQGPPETNQNDVVVTQINAMMELLNKLVDHVIRKDGNDEHHEPDGDEADDPSGDDEADDADGDQDMADNKEKNKTQPIVSASADVATLEGRIAALEADNARLRKEREDEKLFAALKAELAPYQIANFDAELTKHVTAGTAKSWAEGIKSLAPPTKRPSEAPSESLDAPEVSAFLAKNPKADPVVVRHLASVYAASPEFVRKHTLERYLAIQLEMGN